MEPCIQETNIALVKQSTEKIQKDVGKVLKILEGNGSNGLTTRVALNRQAIRRVWWWVGGISFSIAAIAFYVIKKAL